jgi:hypothetical protein
MTITVDSGRLPAMSTTGIMSGTNDESQRVDFAADHRAARAMIEALAQGEYVEVDAADYMILRVADPKEALAAPVPEEA